MRAKPFLVPLLATACNSAPEALQVSITPADPTTSDDLAAEITGELVDPDGDEVTTSFTWYQDEQARPDLTELIVPASETAKGQRWKLFVLPTDGRVDGPPSESEILVLNTPPAVEAVTLEPTVPLTTEDVVATVTVDDEDGDTVTLAYSWHLGEGATGYQEATLPASATTRGDVWTLHITPSDDEGSGDEVLASVSIDNSAPELLSVSLAPTTVYEGTTLEATAVASDEDGDTVSFTYAWMVDGELALEGAADTLTGEHFDKGQEVTVVATPNDGFVDGEPAESNRVTVLNSAPGVDSASIAWSLPTKAAVTEDSTLSCQGHGWRDDDAGDPEGYRTTWFVNGGAVTLPKDAEDRLDGASFARGDSVTCALVAWDGEDEGNEVHSAAEIVTNSPPVVAGLSLSSSAPVEGETLEVTVAASDADGDTLSFSYEWTVDGLVVATTAASGSSTDSIDSALFDKHQSIVVLVTPHDGIDDGAPVTSSTATAANTPPVFDSLVLSHSSLYTDDTISALVATSDADGDELTLSYAWTVDGSPTGSDSASLNGLDWFDKGQVVAVTVTADDGDGTVSDAPASVTVLNSPPSAPALRIDPEEPEAEVDDLLCSIVTESVDPDGDDFDYVFTWEVDGVAFTDTSTTTHPDDTVSGADTQDDEAWTCAVTATDSEGESSVGTVEVTTEYLVDPMVSCGVQFTCVLDRRGEISCWGSTSSNGLDAVPEGTFVHIDAGWGRACALDTAGEPQCWGRALDDGTTPDPGPFVWVGSHEFTGFGLQDDGQIQSWGSSSHHAAPSGTFSQLDVGWWDFACAINTAQAIQCWGDYDHGQRSAPSGQFATISLGYHTGCGIDTSGALHCWGNDGSGQATPPSGTFTAVSAGEHHSCGIDDAQEIQCWGAHLIGGVDTPITPPSGTFESISSGQGHDCAIDTSGTLHCWGDDSYGQSTVPSELLVP